MGKIGSVLQPPPILRCHITESKACVLLFGLHLPTHQSIKSIAQGSARPLGSRVSVSSSQPEHKPLVSHRAFLCAHKPGHRAGTDRPSINICRLPVGMRLTEANRVMDSATSQPVPSLRPGAADRICLLPTAGKRNFSLVLQGDKKPRCVSLGRLRGHICGSCVNTTDSAFLVTSGRVR